MRRHLPCARLHERGRLARAARVEHRGDADGDLQRKRARRDRRRHGVGGVVEAVVKSNASLDRVPSRDQTRLLHVHTFM
jgi:hypothetical protein